MKALVLGATGATGKELISQLLQDSDFTVVHTFTRSVPDVSHPKLRNHVVDFESPEEWKNLVIGDVAFSCMGTTLKAAGSKAAQRKVDYDYQLHFAEAAKQNGVPDYILVSAYGASPTSKLFYSRIKGELETSVKSLHFDKLTILNPGMLDRKDSNRQGEILGAKAIRLVNKFGLFKNQTPLPTEVLAQAMIKASKIKSNGISHIQLQNIASFANKTN